MLRLVGSRTGLDPVAAFRAERLDAVASSRIPLLQPSPAKPTAAAQVGRRRASRAAFRAALRVGGFGQRSEAMVRAVAASAALRAQVGTRGELFDSDSDDGSALDGASDGGESSSSCCLEDGGVGAAAAAAAPSAAARFDSIYLAGRAVDDAGGQACGGRSHSAARAAALYERRWCGLIAPQGIAAAAAASRSARLPISALDAFAAAGLPRVAGTRRVASPAMLATAVATLAAPPFATAATALAPQPQPQPRWRSANIASMIVDAARSLNRDISNKQLEVLRELESGGGLGEEEQEESAATAAGIRGGALRQGSLLSGGIADLPLALASEPMAVVRARAASSRLRALMPKAAPTWLARAPDPDAPWMHVRGDVAASSAAAANANATESVGAFAEEEFNFEQDDLDLAACDLSDTEEGGVTATQRPLRSAPSRGATAFTEEEQLQLQADELRSLIVHYRAEQMRVRAAVATFYAHSVGLAHPRVLAASGPRLGQGRAKKEHDDVAAAAAAVDNIGEARTQKNKRRRVGTRSSGSSSSAPGASAAAIAAPAPAGAHMREALRLRRRVQADVAAERTRLLTTASVAREISRVREVAATAIKSRASVPLPIPVVSPDNFAAASSSAIDRDRARRSEERAVMGSWTRGCCAVRDCPKKALPYLAYCTAHVLLEPRQHLYERCTRLEAETEVQCPHPVTNLPGLPSFCVACSERSLRAASGGSARVAPRLFGRLDPRDPPLRSMPPRELAACYQRIHRLVSAIQSQRRELRSRSLQLRYAKSGWGGSGGGQ